MSRLTTDYTSPMIEQVRRRFPQAFALVETHYKESAGLVVVPGMPLGAHYDHSICTALFEARFDDKSAHTPLNGFWVDTGVMQVRNKFWPFNPQYSRQIPDDEMKSFDGRWGKWRGMRYFWWHAQMHNPNTCSLYTSVMLIKRRLNEVHYERYFPSLPLSQPERDAP